MIELLIERLHLVQIEISLFLIEISLFLIIIFIINRDISITGINIIFARHMYAVTNVVSNACVALDAAV